jgi:hypothetical protein
VYVINLALWLGLVALGAGAGWLGGPSGRTGLLLALLPVAAAVNLTVFVFSEDDYRGNGIRRWDAYYSPGGAIHALYVISIVASGVLAGLLVFAGATGRRRLLGVGAIAGGLAAGVLMTITMIGYSLN